MLTDILHDQGHFALMKFSQQDCIILLIWITAFFFSIPPLFGWSRFVSGVNTCSFDALEDLGYTILLTLIGYVSAALILPILYIKVYKLIKKHQH